MLNGKFFSSTMATVRETTSASVQENGVDLLKVNQYSLHGKLGEGAYGIVLEAEDDQHHRFAVKCLSKSLLKRQKEYTRVGRKMTVTTAFDDVKREIAVMKKLSHPKIVRLIEVVDDPDNDKLFMFMELVNGGQVMEWNKETNGFTANPRLRKLNGTGHEMSEESARCVLRELLVGLDYLHRSLVVHRDLKPQNLLLTNETDRISIKIADFGVSHMFETLEIDDGSSTKGEAQRLTRVKGTFPFYAPECLKGTSFDGYKADIWAVGVNLYCFLTGRLPYYDEVTPTLFDMIENNPVDFNVLTQMECSPSSIEACKLLLEKDCEKRLANARAVMDSNSPWIGDFISDMPLLERIISITEAEMSGAVTRATLSIETVASLKLFVKKWRKRASISAMKRRDDEIRSQGSGSAHSPLQESIRKSPSAMSLIGGSDSSLPVPPPRMQSPLVDKSLSSDSLNTQHSNTPTKSGMSNNSSATELPTSSSSRSQQPSTREVAVDQLPAGDVKTSQQHSSTDKKKSTAKTAQSSSNQALSASPGEATGLSSKNRRRSRACVIS